MESGPGTCAEPKPSSIRVSRTWASFARKLFRRQRRWSRKGSKHRRPFQVQFFYHPEIRGVLQHPRNVLHKVGLVGVLQPGVMLPLQADGGPGSLSDGDAADGASPVGLPVGRQGGADDHLVAQKQDLVEQGLVEQPGHLLEPAASRAQGAFSRPALEAESLLDATSQRLENLA